MTKMKPPFRLVGIHLLFLFLTILLFVSMRSEVKNYFEDINTIKVDIDYARQQAALDDQNIEPTVELIGRIEGPTTRMRFLAFVAFPVLFLIFWILSQGYTYAALKKQHKTILFMKHYAPLSTIFLLILIGGTYALLNPSDVSPLAFLKPLIFFCILYILMTLTTLHLNKNLLKACATTFTKKSIPLLPFTFLLLILALLQIDMVFYIYLLLFTGAMATKFLFPTLVLLLSAYYATVIKRRLVLQTQ